ncbi:MAG TPA: glycosyltransferase family 39 protein [Gammaproteobacteria bacterium]|nr:glycosyltransferase family 39 protein [Gammaproteobacteria bacterium]
MTITSSKNNKASIDLFLLFTAAFIIISAGIGLRDPWPADEPRYALVAKQMVESGQWFFPFRGDELYPDKPPLFMWVEAFFYWLTGSLRFAFLMPSLLAGLFTLGLTYDLGRRLWNHRIGIIAGWTLLATVQFTLQAKTAQIDAMLCLWVTLALYGFCRHLLQGPDWRWYYLGFAAVGLGVITKGVGIIALLVFVPWFFARQQQWRLLTAFPQKTFKWWIGPITMLGVISAWLLPMLILVHISNDPALEAYRDNILFKQTGGRYAHSWGHIKPFWYFFVSVIPVFWLPLSLAFPWLIPAWWHRLQRKDARYLLLLGYALLALLFFSFSAGKRGVYVLPLLPAVALASAALVPGLMKKVSLQKTFWSVLALLSTGLLLFFLYATVVKPDIQTEVLQKYQLNPWGLILAIAVLGISWLFWGWKQRQRRGVIALSGFFLSLWLIYGWYGYPTLNDGRSSRQLMAKVGQRLGPEGQLALVNWKEQTLLMADRKATTFGFTRPPETQLSDALQWVQQPGKRFILLQKPKSTRCIEFSPTDFLGRWHQRDWYLIDQQAISSHCKIQ